MRGRAYTEDDYMDDRPRMRGTGRSRMTSVVIVLAFAWLIIGAIAAGQRSYFTTAPENCASTGTIAVTVFAGPLNYLGINPKVENCHVDAPQPSP